MKEQKLRKIGLNLIYGICLAFTIAYYYSLDSKLNARTVIMPAIIVAGYYIADQFWLNRSNVRKWLMAYSVLFATAMVVGYAVCADNSIKSVLVPFSNTILSLLKIIGFSLSAYMLLVFIDEKCDKIKISNQRLELKHKLIIGVTLFVCFLLAYLAFYPGAFSYDMRKQTWELMANSVERHHPPLHTYYWGLCLWLYKITGAEAIILYSVSQMLMMAWACTEVVVFIYEKYGNVVLLIGSIIFFCSPAVVIMSFICTKDVTFSIFLILTIVSLLRKSKYDNVKSIVFGAISCLLRNNAIYALLLALLIVLLIPKKTYQDKFYAIKYMLVIAIVYFVVDKGVYVLIGVGPGLSQEKLSVPMQQLTSVMYYEAETVSDGDKEAIDFFFPDEGWKEYNPRFADCVKNYFSSERYDENKELFWKTWISVGITHPDNYINAFLTLNVPFWYPDASPRDEYSDRHYIETMVRENDYYYFERKSLLPGYYSFLMKFANYDDIAEVPLVSLLYSIALPVWILLATIAFALDRKKISTVIIALPILMLWISYLAGPVSNFRYIFPLYMLYPFCICSIVGDRLQNHE